MQSLLYSKSLKINDGVEIIIPTVGEVLDNEESYYTQVSMLTAMPIDMMVPLDDSGIDFTSIGEYDLFLILFNTLKGMDTSLVFGELDLREFKLAVSAQNGQLFLINEQTGVRIDRAVHGQIAAALRRIHRLEKNLRKPGNEEAKRFMLERARKRMRRRAAKEEESRLEPQIVALVNTAEFPYGYEETREISIYQFNASLRQISHKINYDHRMYGVYSGTVSVKDLSESDLSWLKYQ